MLDQYQMQREINYLRENGWYDLKYTSELLNNDMPNLIVRIHSKESRFGGPLYNMVLASRTTNRGLNYTTGEKLHRAALSRRKDY